MQEKIKKSFKKSKILQMLMRAIGLRVRILSIVIFCSALILSIKVNHFMKNLHSHDFVQLLSPSYAEELLKPAVNVSEQKQPAAEPLKNQLETQGNIRSIMPSVAQLKSDPITAEQFKALEQLNTDDVAINKPVVVPVQQAIDSAIKNKIEQQVNELDKARLELESLVKGIEEKDKANLGRLIKMAESMKPEEASKILETLELPVLMDLIEGIKPAKGAAILAVMDASKAGYLMNELAKRQKIIKTQVNNSSSSP